MKLLIILFLSFVVGSCSINKTFKETDKTENYCNKIDSLILERYELKTGNYLANRIIPHFVKKSKIESSSEKGYYGYQYKSDSLFNSDIQKWKEYFKCK